jgi:hypothetical protein
LMRSVAAAAAATGRHALALSRVDAVVSAKAGGVSLPL